MKRKLFILIVITIGLIVVESSLRLYSFMKNDGDDENIHRIHDFFYNDENGFVRIKPNAQGLHRAYDHEGNILVRINSSGIRGPELFDYADKRLIFIGDSITFAGGVKDDSTFIALLQDKFHAIQKKEVWEFLNLGTTDTGIIEHFNKIKYQAIALRPHVIFICLYLNDSRPPQGFIGEGGQKSWELWLKNSFLFHSFFIRKAYHIFRLLKITHNQNMVDRFAWVKRFKEKNYLADLNDWQRLVEEAKYDWGSAWEKDSWDIIGENLRKINELLKRNNCSLAIIIFPVYPQIYIDYPCKNLKYPQEQASILAEQLKIPFLDLLPHMRKSRDQVLLADQCHLTSSGNKVVSDVLYQFIYENYAVKK